MKRIAYGLLAAAVSLSGGTAFAADLLPNYTPPPPAPPVVPITNWTGVYFGLQGGYGWTGSDNGTYGLYHLDAANGFVGGGHLGYLWQFGNFVIGGEGDLEYANMNGSTHFLLPGAAISTDENYDFLASARLKAGFAWQRFMIYATGGWAYGDASTNIRSITRTRPPTYLAYDKSEGLNGWTVGGGVEALVTPHISVGVEYRYTDLGSSSFLFNNVTGKSNNTFSAVRGRISYKF